MYYDVTMYLFFCGSLTGGLLEARKGRDTYKYDKMVKYILRSIG